MHLVTLFSMAILSMATPGSENGKINGGDLNGTWLPVKQEVSGKELPAGAFQNQKLVIADSTYEFTAESVDKGVAKFNNGKIDIYGKEGVNKGKHFTGIYKLENGELTICYNLSGDGYPEAFETKSKPTLFLCVFRKKAAK